MLNFPIGLGAGVLCCFSIQAQTGLSPREVSPEIVRQMKREAASGISSAEASEFRKLREADAELMRRIQAVERKRDSLERYVGSLDITIDTKLLTEAKDDIKELKRAQQAAEEEAKAERESARSMISTVKTGVLLLIFGAVFKWAVSILQSQKEKALRETRHGSVMGALDEAKSEANRAYNEANHVNEKIASIGMKLHDEAQTDRDEEG